MAAAEFDTVVVGGGAAGWVVAARLTEAASHLVHLVEAGPDPRPNLPDIFIDGWTITREFDWGYTSEADGRGVVEKLRRGKVLGGNRLVHPLRAAGSGGRLRRVAGGRKPRMESLWGAAPDQATFASPPAGSPRPE